MNKAKDGRDYYEDRIVTPLRDSEGNISHFVSTGRDITKSKRTEEALRRLNDRLEHEAARIASALHDEAGQFLTSAHITLASVARELPPLAREGLQGVKRDLDAIEEQLRRLAHELRPRILEDLGLADALRFLADGIARRSGIPIGVEVSLQTRCNPLVETALYRLVQEGLTNMTKYARATRGTVVLAEDGENVRCSVSDDGVGFDLSTVQARRDEFGLGLLGIQDRLEAVDGVLEIISAPGQGTELRAIIPVEP
jgi:signal transduction histidine kinase